MIITNEDNVFHLQTEKTSYIFRVLKSGQLEALYYGKKIRSTPSYTHLYDKHKQGYPNSVAYSQQDTSLSLDHIPLEYSSYGKGDFRKPAVQLLSFDDVYTTDFKFKTFGITKAKPELKGMPSSYGESETLTVVLEDEVIGAELHLLYTVFENCNIITRSARLINKSENPIKIRSMMSMQLDLPKGNYTMLTFDGAWSRERYKHEHELSSGICEIGSITGFSSNRHNPFFAVKRDECTQETGECYGFNLVYSGNHIARAETGTHGILRIQNGINPFEFEWLVKKNDYFDTPESVLTFSSEGLNGMSRNMHEFVKEHIVRGYWKHRERPILVNNWEATYFNFDEKKILSIAAAAKDIGAEMFVLDDGWFGKRNNDRAGLGDWTVNKKKIPDGIDGLSRKINEIGLKFGLWVEPEMVNPDSQLYKLHPDWAVTTDKYEPSQSRNQFVLDLTRDDVCEYIINTMTDVFRSGNIEYIKWDCNRHFSDVFSRRKGARSGEFFHRYIIGLYKIWDTLTQRFPQILFEACSSGGNRFDLATFCYMPQCWTSDNTDALDRQSIQTGTSYGYPQSVMTMHVSGDVTFHDLRYSNIENRFNVAAFGLLGYELDVTKFTRFERAAVKKQIEYYKRHRMLLQYGEFKRIGDVFKDPRVCIWEITSKDKTESMLGYFVNRYETNNASDIIRFTGLDESFDYRLKNRPQIINIKDFGSLFVHLLPVNIKTEDSPFYDAVCDIARIPIEKEEYVIGGDSLMNSGFKPIQTGSNPLTARIIFDNDSRMYYLKKES